MLLLSIISIISLFIKINKSEMKEFVNERSGFEYTMYYDENGKINKGLYCILNKN